MESLLKLPRFVTNDKIDNLYDSMEAIGIDVLFITDSEDHREVNMRYLTGHPEDASLFVDIKNRQTILVPWDFQLAQKYAEVNQIVDVAEYNGSVIAASAEVIKSIISSNSRIGVLRSIPYYFLKTIVDQITEPEIIYDPMNIDNKLDELRATKSPDEISKFQKSFHISNQLVDEIENNLMNKWDRSSFREIDLAIFVESRMRELGAMGVGFETLVASSARSWQIHTYPRAHPELPLYRNGLALIDFGVEGDWLRSDVTIPFVMGTKTDKMKKITEVVEEAHYSAIDALKELTYLHEVADVAVNIIEHAGFSMPHALGHGIGLTVHDSPGIRKKPVHEALLASWKEIYIEEGMVLTIEPGIYEQDVGGFRLENDIIITSKGPEVVTNSRTIVIDS